MTSPALLREPAAPGPGEWTPPSGRDADWFARVYEATVDSVYRYARVLVRTPERAEDVAAEVYMRAWRSRERLRDESAVQPWLLTITHNVAMNMLGRTREVADLSAVSEREDESASPESRLFADANAAAIRAAIVELTTEQQQVVFLRFFVGLPHEEVANRLGKNPNAVRAIQFRALGRLRKLLEASLAELV